jgi:predicted deacylase
MLQGSHAKTRKTKKQVTATHLEDAPRGAAMDPQRLVQRSVERGAVVAELSP